MSSARSPAFVNHIAQGHQVTSLARFLLSSACCLDWRKPVTGFHGCEHQVIQDQVSDGSGSAGGRFSRHLHVD
jgi:hypothetical protein